MAMGVMDMFLKASCVQQMEVFARLQHKFIGSFGEVFCLPVCYSGYTLTDVRHEERTRKIKDSPSIHTCPLNSQGGKWVLGRWLSNASGACYACILSAGMDYHISQKAVASLQDKNKHYNLAEWAVGTAS